MGKPKTPRCPYPCAGGRGLHSEGSAGHPLQSEDLLETIFPYLTSVEGLELAAQTFDRDDPFRENTGDPRRPDGFGWSGVGRRGWGDVLGRSKQPPLAFRLGVQRNERGIGQELLV